MPRWRLYGTTRSGPWRLAASKPHTLVESLSKMVSHLPIIVYLWLLLPVPSSRRGGVCVRTPYPNPYHICPTTYSSCTVATCQPSLFQELGALVISFRPWLSRVRFAKGDAQATDHQVKTVTLPCISIDVVSTVPLLSRF